MAPGAEAVSRAVSAPFHPRVLGRSGVTVFPVGLGGGYGAPGRVFDMALERGVNFFFYGPVFPTYLSMTMWLSSRTPAQREKIVIATVSYVWRLPGSLGRSVRRHLRFLKTDYLDFFFLGWIRSQDEHALEEITKMKEKGLIRHLAFSAHDRKLAARLAREWPVDAVMIRYNIAHRGAEKEVFPHLPAKDRPGVIGFNAQKHGRILRQTAHLSESTGLTPTDLYRFALGTPPIDMVLAGPRTVPQLEGLLRAVDLGPLDKERYKELCSLGDALHKRHE